MKLLTTLFLGALVLAVSCNPKPDDSEALFNTTWELIYISGPRIAFDGLFPEKKPQITFDKETHQVSGSDSCNGYSTDFELDENTISFGEPGPTTMMFCGGGERQFLNMMQKIDGYIIQDGELNLMTGEVPMLRFKKVEP